MKLKIKKAYDEFAEAYFEMRKGSGTPYFFNELLEMPTTLKILGNVKGKKILDLGCGPGRYANILSKKGAKVIGLDNSINSLEIAKGEAPKAEFILGDVEKLPFKSGTFDIVLSALVIGHLKNWDKVFKEVKRVLKKNGIFVFSNYTPIRSAGRKKKWARRKFILMEDYFDERPIYGYWSNGKKKLEVVHFHKTYGTVIKIITHNGFEILDYEDCKPLKKAKKLFPRYYREAMDFPNFCVWKVRKK
ncbi:MAG: methyltransferase domain-containing protein [Nanoarchaeota archaeon]|nr:methyltransferase domain-containing protein [Nanoarchaeota archaeon]